jgi:leucyl aminopeptidase (aminopeptidase T)
MKTIRIIVGAVFAVTAGFLMVLQAESDKEGLARKLVYEVAGVQENDLVLISGGTRDFELLENMATHVRMLGAHPLVTVGSERMERRYYDMVPAKYDSQTPEFASRLAGLVTVAINVAFGENPGLLSDVAAERIATLSKANAPTTEVMLKRNVRQVFMGNDMYPTANLAKQWGVSQEELAKIFWAGVNTDYAKLRATGEAVRSVLASGKEAHITNPNGTDLKVRIEGRPVFISDGVISPEDAREGGSACQVWLPAGEVYLAPVPGTAEGKVVVDHQFVEGKKVSGLTLTYKAGKLVSMTGQSGMERLQAQYDAAGEGKDLFAYIDVGINADVYIVPGSKMNAWMPAGNVTVGVGNNSWTGGGNYSAFALANFLPGSTLTVDGKVLVENGKLKL